MIAFGCSITSAETYDRAARRGFDRVREPDSVIVANSAAGSIFRSYNLIIDTVCDREDLEALVIVHQDAEIVDPDFCAKIRAALADPDVGLIGCVGAVDVRSIAWWEGSITWASFVHRYSEYGGGDLPSMTWDNDDLPGFARLGEVETLDGFVLVLSPWVARNLRFDDSLGQQMHGYDLDFCLQVREAGRKVVTADLKMIHHHRLELVSDPGVWINAHKRLAEKWHGRMPNIGRQNWGASDEDWKERARQAEAEAGLTRLDRRSVELRLQAIERQLRRELEEVTTSTSWRVTRPLRQLSALLRSRRNGAAPR